MPMGPTQDARDNGDAIIFGSPDAIRGGSHIGSLGAVDMVEAGLCDALTLDYYCPAMLGAAARLDREKRAARPTLWSRSVAWRMPPDLSLPKESKMRPLKIGACLRTHEIAAHRDWIFDADRDVEFQDFLTHEVLTGDWRSVAASARTALEGHGGRVGIHVPFEGLDINNKDPELRPSITARFLTALKAADAVGGRQMVMHSPYNA